MENRFRRNYIMLVALLILMLLSPVMAWAAYYTGYKLILKSYMGTALIQAIAYVVSTVYICKSEKTGNSIATGIMRVMLFFLTIVNWIFFMFQPDNVIPVLAGAVCYICSVILLFPNAKKLLFRILMGVVVSFLSVFMAFFAFMMMLVGQFGYRSVVRSELSPNGTYRADIIDSNDGAFGGDTIVDVYETDKVLDLYVLKFEKMPQQIYIGPWGKFETMQLQWMDEQTLLIDGEVFKIS